MTHYSINIERVTPEIKKVMEQLQGLAGVTILPERRSKVKSESAWDKAIAAGAVTPQEFHARLENEIRNNW